MNVTVPETAYSIAASSRWIPRGDYTRVKSIRSIWRLPLAGGPAVKLVDGIASGAFDVAKYGIYYIDRVSGEAGVFFTDRPGGETRLRYFDFATAQSTTIVRDLGAVFFGLSASGEGRTVLFTRIDSSIDEVLLVDNFR
jgi:hypothetical protein